MAPLLDSKLHEVRDYIHFCFSFYPSLLLGKTEPMVLNKYFLTVLLYLN